MKIRKIYIDNFGKFNNYSIDLDQGLNIIYGPNEAGKSTLMAFISMVFYGSKQRSQDLLKNPREKYSPWDNSTMSGHIVLDCDLGQVRIQRVFGNTNKKDQVEIFNNITGAPIILEDYQAPGKELFGMDLEEFEKTVFIDSDSINIKGKNHKIQDKLAATFTDRESSNSVQNVISNLEKKLYSLKSKRGDKGELVDLERDIEKLSKDIISAEEAEEERISLEKELEFLEKALSIEKIKYQIDQINQSKERARELNQANSDRKNIDQKIKDLEADILKAKAYLNSDRVRLDDQNEMLSQDKLAKSQNKEAIIETKKEIDKENKNLKKLNSKTSKYTAGAAFIIGLGSLLAGYIIPINLLIYIGFGIVALSIILSIISEKYKAKTSSKLMLAIDQETNKLDELEKEASAIDMSLNELKASINVLDNSIEKNKMKIVDLNYQIEEAREYRKKLSSSGIFQSLDPRIFEKEDQRLINLEKEYSDKKSEFEREFSSYDKYVIDSPEASYIELMKKYEERKAYGKERFKGELNLDQAKYLYKKAEERKLDLENEYQATKLAIQGIEKAKGRISSDFTPLLNRKSQEILEIITLNKYNKLLISEDFSVKVFDQETNQYKDFEYFSSGTRDQIFLAIRIGLSKILSKNTRPILILDDVLVKFDKNRSEKTINTLKNLQENFDQIILFTCNQAHIENVNDKVNKIYL